VSATRVAVVGAGHMGRLHARKLAELDQAGEPVVLAAVVDTERERAADAAEAAGARVATHVRELTGACDAAVVAVPTVDHHAVVGALLDAGIDVLVEKPIAASLAEGRDLLARADKQGRVLQVGHLERFNAALVALRARIRRPRFIEGHRMGPFPARATDIDVVRDLMIHDLDLIQQLIGEEPASVEAIGVPVLTDKVDIANARVRFPSGCIANLTASRVSPTPMRKLRCFQTNGYFSIDLLAQSAVVMTRTPPATPGGRPGIDRDEIQLRPDDALRAELQSFLRAVRERTPPEVSGAEALRALQTALRVNAAMPPLEDGA